MIVVTHDTFAKEFSLHWRSFSSVCSLATCAASLPKMDIFRLNSRQLDILRRKLQTISIFGLLPFSAMLSLLGLPNPAPALLALPLLGLVSYIWGQRGHSGSAFPPAGQEANRQFLLLRHFHEHRRCGRSCLPVVSGRKLDCACRSLSIG